MQRQKLIYLVMQDVNHQLFTESVLDEVLISQSETNEEEGHRILASLDLYQFANRHPQSLSGGQTLCSLQQLGKTVIVVTHDRELIKECCNEEIRLCDFNCL